MFNTEDLYDQVGQELLSRRNREFSNDLKMQLMGLPGPVAYQLIIDQFDLDDSIETLQRESDEIFSDLLPREIRMLPGLEQTLSLIESLNLPKAIATSSHQAFATLALAQFDLAPRFEFILTPADVTHGKPDPEIYLQAAQRFGIPPAAMLVLEDSVHGSRAGAASGAVTIAIPGHHSAGGDFSHAHHVETSLAASRVLEVIRS
ncbi:MAG: HAD-IA family hydrolase [Mariniblastus sp.]|nr:HAD-IA family hydrolase [Mariniblastus sp.]